MITVRHLGDLVIYAGAIAAALAALAVVARYVILQPLKRFIEHILTETIGATVHRVTTLERRFDDHVTSHPGSSR